MTRISSLLAAVGAVLALALAAGTDIQGTAPAEPAGKSSMVAEHSSGDDSRPTDTEPEKNEDKFYNDEDKGDDPSRSRNDETVVGVDVRPGDADEDERLA